MWERMYVLSDARPGGNEGKKGRKSMKLSDEKNLEFMNNKERLNADARLRKAIKHIEDIKTLSAETILICMPPALNELSEAYENLNRIEARLEYELGQSQ